MAPRHWWKESEVGERHGAPKRGFEESEVRQIKSQDVCQSASDVLRERGKVVRF